MNDWKPPTPYRVRFYKRDGEHLRYLLRTEWVSVWTFDGGAFIYTTTDGHIHAVSLYNFSIEIEPRKAQP